MHRRQRAAPRVMPVFAIAAWLAAPWSPAVPAHAQEQAIDLMRDVGIDQRLGHELPGNLMFVDETGKPARLGDYFRERPVVLVFAYYECPMLCTLVLNGVVRCLRALSFDVGAEFDVLTVSIDPTESADLAAAKKASVLETYGREGSADGWHFLTGSEASIRDLCRAAGFRYAYDEARAEYAHASGIMVAAPGARLTHYFYGIEYSARDLRLALVEAGQGRVGSAVDQVLLFCYHYDPATGKYGAAIMNTVRLAGLVTVTVLGALVFVLLRRERTRRFGAQLQEESAR